jgi:general L-amino acid transport system permease protein
VLPLIELNKWGGLLLTFILTIVGIVFAFPIGIMLALGRRSDLPIIKWICITYIELVRGVPFITVLFMGMILLPLVLPGDVRIAGIIRAMVAVTLFSAAYLAENVRGGLQSISRGQSEAARALGLNPFQEMYLIVLPQALRAVIPPLVGQFISLFKDTTLVAIVGLLDFLKVGQSILAQAGFLGAQKEVYTFVAVVFFIFSFAMSQASIRLEQKLGVGVR